ncbi:MAG TPA: hypothetical protein VJ826_00740 [Candidatus Polarisedimenticolaceae bacterium]|nr:hypothetical protein [Candidatus Polarisedimenticolaceae bacterium]
MTDKASLSYSRTDTLRQTRSSGTWTPPNLEVLEDTYERVPSFDSAGVNVAAQVDATVKGSGLQDFVAGRFFSLPDVLAVVFQRGQDALHVWTVVRDIRLADRDGIYDLELALMEQFRDVRFDFYVVGSGDRAVEHALDSSQACVIRREDAVN